VANLLYLVHRIPYPPNKGDKVRSYHLLKHLTARNSVFLGTFIDDPDDEAYVNTVRSLCSELHVARITPKWAKLRSLTGLAGNRALSLDYYRNAGMQLWVRRILQEQKIDAIVIFSSVMAQFVIDRSGAVSRPMLVDFVDVDSYKWSQYANDRRWPLSWLYRREGARLLAFERAVAVKSKRSFFVTENETELFRSQAPECAATVQAMSNGVDSDYFSPSPSHLSPFAVSAGTLAATAIVFTGAMDYWPNIDAVTWFVSDILPALQDAFPNLCFYIVGRSPPASVQALASASVVVTGTVPDVRPYLQHASLVVAPLRVARGIQNKILEAMAMARPVVASQSCVDAIDAKNGAELIGAATAEDFVNQICALLNAPQRAAQIGLAGRQRVVQQYSWAAHMAAIDNYVEPAPYETV
jgi:polysaccharide biosynthesis protein PslH